jgi:hypothetical protein
MYLANVKSTGVYLGVSIAILLGAGLALDCGSGGHAAGSVGGACLTGGACNGGLVCLSEICVQPAAAGGAGGGSTGAAGAGGSGAALGMACTAARTMTAPSNGLIADFSSPDGGLQIDGGLLPSSVVEIGGGLFAYPGGSASAPAYSLLDGVLHITVNTPATSAPQYIGMFLGFNDCIDATAFTGVSFTISGSFAGCTMLFFAGDVEHSDLTVNTYLGTGPAGSYPPQSTLTPSEVTAAPQTLMTAFTNYSISGSPPTPLDKTKLISVSWQFTVAAGTSSTADAAPAACVADITIDNVSFY